MCCSEELRSSTPARRLQPPPGMAGHESLEEAFPRKHGWGLKRQRTRAAGATAIDGPPPFRLVFGSKDEICACRVC